MKSWPTPKYLKLCGELVRCIRCHSLYMTVELSRDPFDQARGYMPCPKCEAELKKPRRRRVRNHIDAAGCALFVACVLAWALVL